MNKDWEAIKKTQPTAVQILENSLKQNRLAHAYLFEGMRGTGKKKLSLLIAKSYFCSNLSAAYLPCGHCLNCQRIASGNHPDVHIVEPDGLSIKKDQVSRLQEEFAKTGLESNKKFYIIVDAEKMTINAANSLLKFLEEPHQETIAILITENIQQIIPTIFSRCQVINFRPLSAHNFAEQLMLKGISKQQAHLLSQMTSNLNDALELSIDEWFAQAQTVVVKLYAIINRNKLEPLVYLQTDWFNHFVEKDQLDYGLDLLLLIYKDILNLQLKQKDKVIFSNMIADLEQDAIRTTQMQIAERMATILEAKRKLQANVNPQLLMEQLVLKLQEGSSFV